MLTEEQAKDKWCPEGVFEFKSKQSATIPIGCIGSACMAWRWNDFGSVSSAGAAPANSRGFCGKAGPISTS